MADAIGSRDSDAGWRRRSSLITGITGFIGSQLAHRLSAQKTQVVGLARSPGRSDSARKELQHRNISLVRGDLQDRELLHQLLDEHKPTMIFHLAADALVSQEADPSRYQVNVSGTRNLLDAMVSASPDSVLLFTSTAAVYEPGSGATMADEDSPTSPRNDYTRSKLEAESLLQEHISEHGISAGIVRLTNVYGPGDLNFSRLIPGSMRSIVTGHNPVLRSDGSSQHDFVYIEDVLDALTVLMSRLLDGQLCGEVFNIAAGANSRAIDVVEELVALAQREDLVIETGPPASQQQVPGRISVRKAERLLNWKARTELHEGLANTLDWYQYLTPELTRSGWT